MVSVCPLNMKLLMNLKGSGIWKKFRRSVLSPMQIIRKHDDEEDVEIIINGVSVLAKIISLKMYEYSGIDRYIGKK